jgi:protein-S-isoprenylcysteine O-methyltransferase Ste14
MMRKPIILEGKSIDFGLASLFAFLALVSLINSARQGSDIQRIESMAAVPLLIAASCSFALRRPAKVPTYMDETLIPTLSYLSPFLVLNADFLLGYDLHLPTLSLIAIPGIVLTCISMFYLRSSFSILPSIRQLVTTGPYRFIRHPIYFGEVLYVLGVMLLAFNILSILFFFSLIVLLLARIRIEERKLMAEPAYLGYAKRVKYRFIPLIY